MKSESVMRPMTVMMSGGVFPRLTAGPVSGWPWVPQALALMTILQCIYNLLSTLYQQSTFYNVSTNNLLSTLYLQSTFYNVSTIYFLHCVYNLLSTLYLRSSFYMYNIHLQSTFYNALLLTSTAVTHHAAMFKIHFIQTRKTTLNAHFWPPVPPILRTPEADLYIICGDGMGYTLGTMGRHRSQDI